ncbi:unnamed protein product [Urochloa humidicola]
MDFTFPATTTATPDLPPPAAAASCPAPPSACRPRPLPRFAAARPPWFPSSPPSPLSSRATAAVTMPQEEPRPPPPEKSAGHADAAASAAEAELEERMDMLWEDFNEELSQHAARRRPRARPRGGSWRDDRGGGDGLAFEGRPWSEEPASLGSDAESEEPAAARGVGCGPVLRPSARAAAGARHCRRRAGRWVLLMRIFRRLFVVEKTISAVARQRSTASTTRAR